MSELAIVSSSPHAHSGSSVQRIMLDVIIALVPAMAAATYAFGWDAIRLISACVLACVASEGVSRKWMGRDLGVEDLSAVITGILLAFNLPPSLPTWMAVVGSVFAIVICKQLFGGIGYNPFNPALAGRVMLLISFPVFMTTWSTWGIPAPLAVDAITTATPLGLVKTAIATTGELPFTFNGATALQLFVGNQNGCIGEVSAAALLLGGLYMLVRRCISWHIPVAYLGTVTLFSAILWLHHPQQNLNPGFHLLAGGLMLGAIFMATDMVTSPVTKRGMLVFGAGCGLLTMLVRKWGGYPEGVSFAILLMNAVTPLINRATRPRVFGAVKKKKA
ncbi:MAG: RnfABCDGE type electron transport complex subunit D [Verrucomicrobia bacterium]|mgnify:CR=1 FL=1|jgi:Na+-translocating ferredoxin:NAD+ oxidoreductase subunit D|nr:RnfABCDGE type electron transport complex subunit D [Verrucomicrobiota bacterium]MBT7064802.1 RnfABCDGE type electron transport complex subunit D [Verrucomicrobiota bacterium]MBT7702466.1 RnfABCDGE type electron transport complex subunit D [Verrucomicrobiota bacterium]